MSFQFVDIEQNSSEWIELRKSKIGASDAPIIKKVSPWQTPFGLWEYKLNLREGQLDNSRMKRGRDLEAAALEKFNQHMGMTLKPRVVLSTEHEFLMASFDGCDEYGEVIVEIKCPAQNGNDHQSALLGIIPDKYVPQIQHQLIPTKPKRSFYYSFDGENGTIIETEPDSIYIKELLADEGKFFDCMTTFTPPPLMDADYLTREDEEWQEIAEQYLSVSHSLSDLEKQEKILKAKLIELAGKSNVKGAGLSLSRVVRKGSIDYSAIPELKGLDLEPFRKSHSEYWTIRKSA